MSTTNHSLFFNIPSKLVAWSAPSRMRKQLSAWLKMEDEFEEELIDTEQSVPSEFDSLKERQQEKEQHYEDYFEEEGFKKDAEEEKLTSDYFEKDFREEVLPEEKNENLEEEDSQYDENVNQLVPEELEEEQDYFYGEYSE